ncbi:MAG: 1-acyl-sn-glycerol-3-phosphate acyltransferase [Desulfobulbaceae bacterium]|nr:1-acyl-sn-glycerol-3-phosphate acyltransferase [Desulfobulbaceae bacterium]
MNFIVFLRGVFVLALVPLLTLLTSLLAILFLVVFRGSPEKVLILPKTWGRIILASTGVSVKVEGGENLDRTKPYIFAANHQSQYDIFAIQGYFNFNWRWLAKKELFEIPFFGKALQLAGNIPIDRSRGRQALKSLQEAAKRIAAGTSVILFPEGTRSLDGKLHDFKSGGMVLAIKAGVPIVPVGISGTFDILPKGKLLAKPGRVVIRVGNPVPTSDYTVKEKHELAERIKNDVAKLLV